VLAEPGVDYRAGVRATGLVAEPGDVPTVTGVRLAGGPPLAADLVVDAGGRRSPLPAWLHELGVEVDETVVESGLMYLSRWYRWPDGPRAFADPKLGGDLGFVKFLGVPGDGQTLSVTLAIRSDDRDLRRALSDGGRFDQACRLLPGPDSFFRAGPLEPLSEVKPMGGLLNRLRRFVDAEGRPLVLGLHAVGDAHTCTNPLYGRGCSLAVAQAVLLADAVAAHPHDAEASATAYEAACARDVEPWFHVSVTMDRAGADPGGVLPGGDGGKAMAAVFAASATDPVLGRGLVRFWNLLATPLDLMQDGALMNRMAEVMADPDAHPLPAVDGPSRRELLAALHAEEALHA
jgi:2-polyprenyl-6-methoxyphenol hydroxylase-like FAD-dependent oxidoreductase